MTLDGIGDCQALKHMTLKNLVMDDIVIDGELELLISYCSVNGVKLNTNSMTWRYCTMPIAIALLMSRKKRYLIILSDKHGVNWNEIKRYLGLLLKSDLH